MTKALTTEARRTRRATKRVRPMCDCISVGEPRKWQKTPSVILTAPEFMLRQLAPGKTEIAVDACIAEQIRMLWSDGVRTYSSCCGHNSERPSVVVDDGDSCRAKRLLMERDPDRDWQVMYWHHELRERKG